MSQSLFEPYHLGPLTLKNRVVMAPMTRTRALGNVPAAITATYYAQRAEAGLIVTEGTSPSPDGLGYTNIPGLFNAAQVEGWRAVTQAVHAEGGKIFVQLMHTGRVGHAANLPSGARILGPSARTLDGEMFTLAHGMQPHTAPAAMSGDDIAAAIQAYADSAALAIEAGFDGVELHGANGYLIDQFLNTATNDRTDTWGGSVEGRAHFALEVTRRVVARIGAERVGIRLSPYGAFNGMVPDADMDALFTHLASALSDIGIAYVHQVDHSSMGAPAIPVALTHAMRAAFKGTYVVSGGRDASSAQAAIDSGRGDLAAFGRPFISNPRLVSRMRRGAELLPADASTFYAPGPEGYIDYPVEG